MENYLSLLFLKKEPLFLHYYYPSSEGRALRDLNFDKIIDVGYAFGQGARNLSREQIGKVSKSVFRIIYYLYYIDYFLLVIS